MSQSAPTIRVLTWNVHGCVGRDGVRDPNRVARVLEAAQPDISALQEIDSRTRAAAHDPFSYFGELFGWTTVSARTLTAKDGHYGHIVLSRWPIESLGEIDLSMRWSEPRKAIIGAIQVPGARVIVIAVHLGLLPFERRKQFARLRERIETIAEGPLIVLGDFNDFPRRLNQHLLSRSLAVTPPLATYPSRFPLLPLDRICFSAPLDLVTAATLNDVEHVSDHLPLVASLRLDGRAQQPTVP
jgi:endonuclease/exonuclease/phosphatase family metal-dependent hydrolase